MVMYMMTLVEDTIAREARRGFPLRPAQQDRLRELATQLGALGGSVDKADVETLIDVMAGEVDMAAQLDASADQVERATKELEAARASQRRAIRLAAVTDMPETTIAKVGRMNRATVRAALGK